jgi:hypothetical protein
MVISAKSPDLSAENKDRNLIGVQSLESSYFQVFPENEVAWSVRSCFPKIRAKKEPRIFQLFGKTGA